MTQSAREWKLTDQEKERLIGCGGSIAEAQETKKQAYRDKDGIILNPNALPDLYEACKEALRVFVQYDVSNSVISGIALKLNEAITKAEEGE